MKKIKYNTIGKAIKAINRSGDDNIRIALYITNEDDINACDLQLEYKEDCINIYSIEDDKMDFWEFFNTMKEDKTINKDINKIKKELEKLAYIVEVKAYTC